MSSRLNPRVELLRHAVSVLGSKPAAKAWMRTRAPGLDGRRPAELLREPEGRELVRTLLLRMEHGVYT